MVIDPQPPLIIIDGGDLAIFDSVAAAESALEAVDVRADAYRGYDIAGRRLAFSTVDAAQRDVGIFRSQPEVIVSLGVDMQTHETDLANALAKYLMRAKRSGSEASATPDEGSSISAMVDRIRAMQ